MVFKICSSMDDDDMMVVKFVHYQISRRCCTDFELVGLPSHSNAVISPPILITLVNVT